jgi:MATE family multidrug resistance protein
MPRDTHVSRQAQDIGLWHRLSPWRSEARETLALGIPLALSQLAQIAIQTTEVVMLGWLGPEALAAGGLAANVFFIQFLLGLGVATAVSPIVAQIVGRPGRRGKLRDVRRVVRQGFWAASALAVPFMIVCWQVRPILIFFGQDPHLAVMAEAYMHALLWAILPALWFIVLRCFVSAFGRTRAVLAVTLWGVAFNAACGYALIFGHFGFPALGMVGAGISAALTHSSMAALLLAHVLTDRRFRRYALLGRLWRPDWPRFIEIFRIGLPIGAMWVLEGGVFAAALFLMGLIGTTAIAAHQIALQCAAIAFMVPLGISQAATVRVGLAAGAGDPVRIRRAGWAAIGLGTGFMALTCLLFLLAGAFIVHLFLDPADNSTAPVADLAARLLIVAGLFQLFDGAQSVGAGALRGLKDTRLPLAIALIGYWLVAFPLSIALGFGLHWEAVGIWIGLAVGLAVAAVLLNLRFHWRSRLSLAGATAP